jgi:hypothetical protein
VRASRRSSVSFGAGPPRSCLQPIDAIRVVLSTPAIRAATCGRLCVSVHSGAIQSPSIHAATVAVSAGVRYGVFW